MIDMVEHPSCPEADPRDPLDAWHARLRCDGGDGGVHVSVTDAQRIAFERHVVPEIPVLLRVARSLTGELAEAEDLVQDTLIRALGAVDRFDGLHARAWLLTILRNTHINRNRRRRPELLRDPDSATGGLAAIAGHEVTDAWVDSCFDADVEMALADLDEPFRTVVELIDVSGLSYAQAAEQLGVPTGTVMSRLHRARARIRAQLGIRATQEEDS